MVISQIERTTEAQREETQRNQKDQKKSEKLFTFL
jgi:hypothetical protein